MEGTPLQTGRLEVTLRPLTPITPITPMMQRLTLDSPEDFLDYREGSGGSVEIFDIQVNSERGKGRGRQLIELLIELLIADTGGQTGLIFAITRESNLIAQQFYANTGFRLVGRLRQFYADTHEDALMYGRDL